MNRTVIFDVNETTLDLGALDPLFTHWFGDPGARRAWFALPLFAEMMSVDEAGALKPAPDVYDIAVQRLDLAPGSVWMVAAHGWDIAAATRAASRDAFVVRPGQSRDPFAPPEIIADDLLTIAHANLAAEGFSQP